MSSVKMLCSSVHLPKRCGVALQLCTGCFILALIMSSSTSTYHTGITDYYLRWEYLNNYSRKYLISAKVFDTSYILSLIFSGFLCLKYSAGRLFGIAVAGLSFLHLITLLTAGVGFPEVLLVACLKGLLMGLTLSSVITICNVQAPNLKNTTYVSLLLFAFLFGYWVNEICLFNSGNNFWSLSFYLIGFIGLLWSVCWFWLFKDLNSISIYYIHDRAKVNNFKLTKLLSSIPRLCITIVAVCCMLNFCLMNYIVVVLFEKHFRVYPENFSMREFLTCTTAVSTLVVGWLSDFLRGYYDYTTTQVRKIFTCGGLFSSSLTIVFILSFYKYHFGIITLCSCIGVFYILQGILVIGFMVNPLDIAPRFAGLVAGMSFGLALILADVIIVVTTWSLESFVYVDFLIGDVNTFFKAFIILIAFNIFGGIFFWLFGSGEEQKWAAIQIEDNQLLENIPAKEIILNEEKEPQLVVCIF